METHHTTSRRLLMGLSFLIGALVVFLFTRYLEGSTFLYSIVSLIGFIVILSLLSVGLPKVVAVTGNRKTFLWLGAVGGAVLLTLLLSPVLSLFFSASGTVPLPGSADSFREYEDPVLGFRIAYPAAWTPIRRKDPGSDLVTNTAFISRDGKTVATVQVTDFTQPGYLGVPLDTWTNHTIGVLTSNTLSSQFTLLGNERTVFAGHPAQMLDYSAVINSGDTIRTVEYLLEAGSRGYSVGFTSKVDSFNDTASMRQRIFNSFMVTG